MGKKAKPAKKEQKELADLEIELINSDSGLSEKKARRLRELQEKSNTHLSTPSPSELKLLQKIQTYITHDAAFTKPDFRAQVSTWIGDLSSRATRESQECLRDCYGQLAFYLHRQDREHPDEALINYRQHIRLSQSLGMSVSNDSYYRAGILAAEQNHLEEAENYLAACQANLSEGFSQYDLASLHASLAFIRHKLGRPPQEVHALFEMTLRFARQYEPEKVCKWLALKTSCQLKSCHRLYDEEMFCEAIQNLSEAINAEEYRLSTRWEMILPALALFEDHPLPQLYLPLLGASTRILENPTADELFGIRQLLYLVYYGYAYFQEPPLALLEKILEILPSDAEALFWKTIIETGKLATNPNFQIFWQAVAAWSFGDDAMANQFFENRLKNPKDLRDLLDWICGHDWTEAELLHLPTLIKTLFLFQQRAFPKISLPERILSQSFQYRVYRAADDCLEPDYFRPSYDLLLALACYLSSVDSRRSKAARALSQQLVLTHFAQIFKEPSLSSITACFFPSLRKAAPAPTLPEAGIQMKQ